MNRWKRHWQNCWSNLKQIGLGIAMYADNYNGRMPLTTTTHPLCSSFNLLSNVVTSAKVFACPSDSAAKAQPSYGLTNAAGGPFAVSYTYNAGLFWQDQPDWIIALDRMGSNIQEAGLHGRTAVVGLGQFADRAAQGPGRKLLVQRRPRVVGKYTALHLRHQQLANTANVLRAELASS